MTPDVLTMQVDDGPDEVDRTCSVCGALDERPVEVVLTNGRSEVTHLTCKKES